MVNRDVIPAIPGVALIPLSEAQALLALDPGRGLADIELGVIDALEEAAPGPGRRALAELRALLRGWRNDPQWTFEPRTIVVAERCDADTTARHRPARRLRTGPA